MPISKHTLNAPAIYKAMAANGIKNLNQLEKACGLKTVVHVAIRNNSPVSVKTINNLCFVLGTKMEDISIPITKESEPEEVVKEEHTDTDEGTMTLILQELQRQTELLSRLVAAWK